MISTHFRMGAAAGGEAERLHHRVIRETAKRRKAQMQQSVARGAEHSPGVSDGGNDA